MPAHQQDGFDGFALCGIVYRQVYIGEIVRLFEPVEREPPFPVQFDHPRNEYLRVGIALDYFEGLSPPGMEEGAAAPVSSAAMPRGFRSSNA